MPPRPRSEVVLLGCVFLGTLLLRAQVAHHNWPPDDAYITFRYAVNLAAGHGFAYNPGERVLGTTTPLLTLLLAGLAKLGLDPEPTGIALALLCSALGATLLAGIVRQAGGTRWAAATAGALLALSPLQARVGASGMEPPLLVALLLGSYGLVQRRQWAGAALLAGLAAITRPEGLAWLAPLLVGLLSVRPRPGWALLGALLPPLLWLGVSAACCGALLPNSVHAKLVQGQAAYGGPPLILGEVLKATAPCWIVWGALLWGASSGWRADRWRWLPVAFALLFLGAYGVAGPLFYFWYPAPLQAMVCLLVGLALAEASPHAHWALLRQRVSRPSLGVLLTVAASAAWLAQSWPVHHALLTAARGEEPHERLARWLQRHTRPGDRVLVGDVGYVGYRNRDRYFADSYGLVWRAPVGLVGETISGSLATEQLRAAVSSLRPALVIPARRDLLGPGDCPGYVLVAAPELPDCTILRRAGPPQRHTAGWTPAAGRQPSRPSPR